MDITGILHAISETQQVSEKFKKRDFVLKDTSSQYPQFISFQLTQDKCGIIDNYSLAQEIKVHFNLRGRQWDSPQGETKYFNTLESWRIESISNTHGMKNEDIKAAENIELSQQEIDDLPF